MRSGLAHEELPVERVHHPGVAQLRSHGPARVEDGGAISISGSAPRVHVRVGEAAAAAADWVCRAELSTTDQ